MAGNPLVPQGVLNRLRGSVVWDDVPALNITAAFLAKDGIRWAPEGEATTFTDTLTGSVPSPEPYLPCSLRISLLRTQVFSDLYKKRMELNSVLGGGTVRPDTTTLSPITMFNCSIQNVAELGFNGQDAAYIISIRGYYLINSSLWDF